MKMGKSTTLEAAIQRLEEIVEQLDSEVTLDESIKLYAEAVKLVEFAGAKLEGAKLRVEKLSASKEEESKDEAI